MASRATTRHLDRARAQACVRRHAPRALRWLGLHGARECRDRHRCLDGAQIDCGHGPVVGLPRGAFGGRHGAARDGVASHVGAPSQARAMDHRLRGPRGHRARHRGSRRHAGRVPARDRRGRDGSPDLRFPGREAHPRGGLTVARRAWRGGIGTAGRPARASGRGDRACEHSRGPPAPHQALRA
jgi:hypothetical protein